MPAVRVKGIKKVRAKGRDYFYHRATKTRLVAEFGTGEFFAQLATLEQKLKRSTALPGTLGLAITEYRASIFFQNLASATRASYDRVFVALKPLSAMPLVEAKSDWVAKLRDEIARKRGRWMANYSLTVLGIVFDHARERGWMRDNPARNIRRVARDKSSPQANRPWSEEECRVVLAEAKPYLRVPIALAMFLGLRKGDVLRLTKSAIAGGVARLTTRKRGVAVTIPLPEALENILREAPEHRAITIAANSLGEPWSESGFNSTFCKFIARLEERGLVGEGLTMHGLRHSFGTRAREAGGDLDTIRRLLGQRTLAMAQHYCETADPSEQTAKIVARIDMLGNKKG
ncbi:tyrosine-type recombinase/integrase [Rhodoblastus sp.]|uniref:tyrosine-type recombinase/integrase n=1 Tax=Rhodoblastus sp. TaxID=1962975 RepID=UPI00262DAD04|nr:tyrosine-type recombinase/integrase [Rhodoblastus sp.]